VKSPAAGKLPGECSFIELDRLKDDLAAEQARLNLVSDKLEATKAAAEKAQAALDESESKRRQAREAFESAKDAPNKAELAVVAEKARLAAELAVDTLTLRKRELDRERLAQEVQKLKAHRPGPAAAGREIESPGDGFGSRLSAADRRHQEQRRHGERLAAARSGKVAGCQ
jgi:hypothetical protein